MWSKKKFSIEWQCNLSCTNSRVTPLLLRFRVSKRYSNVNSNKNLNAISSSDTSSLVAVFALLTIHLSKLLSKGLHKLSTTLNWIIIKYAKTPLYIKCSNTQPMMTRRQTRRFWSKFMIYCLSSRRTTSWLTGIMKLSFKKVWIIIGIDLSFSSWSICLSIKMSQYSKQFLCMICHSYFLKIKWTFSSSSKNFVQVNKIWILLKALIRLMVAD